MHYNKGALKQPSVQNTYTHIDLGMMAKEEGSHAWDRLVTMAIFQWD
jgi:hypothetical protein